MQTISEDSYRRLAAEYYWRAKSHSSEPWVAWQLAPSRFDVLANILKVLTDGRLLGRSRSLVLAPSSLEKD